MLSTERSGKSTEKEQSSEFIENPAASLDEIEVNAAITAQYFLACALDHAAEELDAFDAAAQRKAPDLAGSILTASALVYFSERLVDGCGNIANALHNFKGFLIRFDAIYIFLLALNIA